MALQKDKAEHAGDKGSSRKDGFWGKRVDAKKSAKKLRRTIDKKEAKETNG